MPQTMLYPPAFLRLAWSNFAAQSAEQVALAAAPLVAVLTFDAGTGATGLLQAAQTLPFLLLSITVGLLADRTASRPRLLAAAEVLRAASLALILVLIGHGLLTLPLLALLGFVGAAGTVAYSAATPALDRGVGAAVVLPHVNIEAMNVHLAEISRSVTHGAHGVLVLDQAGWHTSRKLRVPDNISLLSLPPYAPELNPVEQVWAFLRANFLGHRVWNNYNAIVNACCDAWNKLMNMPLRLASITRRTWAELCWDLGDAVIRRRPVLAYR